MVVVCLLISTMLSLAASLIIWLMKTMKEKKNQKLTEKEYKDFLDQVLKNIPKVELNGLVEVCPMGEVNKKVDLSE